MRQIGCGKAICCERVAMGRDPDLVEEPGAATNTPMIHVG